MPTLKIKVTHNGKPVKGAQVTVGERASAVTDTNGEISKTVPADFQPIAVGIIIEHSQGVHGGGPYKLIPDQTLEIEV